MRSFLIYSQEFGTDFNPFPPGHIHDGCLIRSMRSTYVYFQDDSETGFMDFIEQREIPHHWEFIRAVVPTVENSWNTKYTVHDIIVIHVYSEDDALEARLNTDARPLGDGWRERIEQFGVGEDDFVN
jgi:hypothetical protein